MTSASRGRVCVGRIAGAHGVKGLVKILCCCEDPQLLEKADEYAVRPLHSQGKFLIAEIDGVRDRDAAQNLKGTELSIDRAALPSTEADEFYFDDLKGLKVLLSGGADGGRVTAVQDFGASPLLEIRPDTGASYYLPFTREYVPEVNIDKGYVVIDPPEGIAG